VGLEDRDQEVVMGEGWMRNFREVDEGDVIDK